MPDQTVATPADMLLLVMHDLTCQKIGMKLANAMHATHTRRANRYLRLYSEFMPIPHSTWAADVHYLPFESTPMYLKVLLLQHHMATSRTLHQFRDCSTTSVNKDI